MPEFLVYSDASLSVLIGDLREAYRTEGRLSGRWKAGKARSLNLNDISHVWYEQMAMEDRQNDVVGHKCYCKLHHGVPILRAEDSDFRETYDAAIKGLTYEQKLVTMKLLPVTSLMTSAQFLKYLEAIQADYAGRNMVLCFPDER